jgi:antirestriction protein ArdC
MRSVSQTVYETITSTILTALRKGVVPWRKPWHVQSNTPVNVVSNKAYRGINVFLLGLSEFRDHRWLTLKQVNDLGGRVITGQRATMVVFWKHWEPKEPDPNASTKRIPILRYYHVFNVEQCDGLKVPSLHQAQPLRENERIERADILVRHMPDPPTIREQGSSAWYRPADDMVQVPPLSAFESVDSFYATLFHELGHATGHEKRLNRAGVTGEIRFGSTDYSKEELVAELTAAFCCATVSLDNSLVGDSASYINGWLNALRSDPKAVVIAAAQAQKAADFIRGVTYH